MTQRCAWTAERADELTEVWLTVPNRWGGSPHEQRFLVSPEHESELRSYAHRLTRFGRLYVTLMVVFVLAAIAFAVLGSRTGEVASLLGMGVILVAFPFATPETVRIEGVRSSVRHTRIAGAALTVLGIGLLIGA